MYKSKSIFRYVGSKSKPQAREAIGRALPDKYSEFRECFVGGGSIFFATPASKRRWVNDLHPELIAVYQALRDRPEEFIALCNAISSENEIDLRSQFKRLLEDESFDPAVRYFILNRLSFNGRVRLDSAYRHRTFFSNPKGLNILNSGRLQIASEILQDVTITCLDFEHVFDAAGEDVLVFADPPYVRDTKLSPSSKLYQKGFTVEDHHRLKSCVDRCPHNVLLTYDDDPMIRELYRQYEITQATWTYTGNTKRIAGRELIITNYERSPKVEVD